MTPIIAPLGRAATYRSLLFLGSALVTGSVAFVLLLTGWLLVAGTVFLTPLVVPVLVGFRAAVGALARGESWLARDLLGADARGGNVNAGGKGFWGRAQAVLTDLGFWREQAYLTLRTFVGWPVAILVLSLLGSSLWFIGLPIYYQWVNADVVTWHVDSLQKAVLLMPVGAIGLVLTLNLVRPLGAVSRKVAEALLRPDAEPRRIDTRALRRRALRAHFATTVVANAVVLIVWAAVGGSFWPGWVIVGTSLALALHAWAEYALSRDDWRRRPGILELALHAGFSVTLCTSYVLMWALSGGGYFWPAWAILGFGIALGVHAVVVYRRGPVVTELKERIDLLESTRAGAVDVRESEARRIERDLHDGAQARLVALGMNLGMAEQRLAADPEAARGLLTEARLGVEEALRELRELARGIHPPVLTDRGLEAAIAALAHRSAIPVFVTTDLPERPPAAVETAAYFVAAEALTNAAKHAGASRVEVRIVREPKALVVEVVDDGRGGADPSGSGLTGLRQRVEALDGKLSVVSPPRGGTTLHAKLPCAS
jgi:signal transduction histidine kinase